MQIATNQGRSLGWALLLCVAVFLMGLLGIALQREAHYIASLWPANAVAFAFLLGRRKADWPLGIAGILAGNLALNAVIGNPSYAAAGYSLINTIEPLIAALLVARFVGQPTELSDLRRLGCFILCGAIIVPAITAFGGAALGSAFYGAQYVSAWRTWWIADSISVLIFAPPIIAMQGRLSALLRRKRHCAELAVLILATLGITFLTFSSDVFPLVYLTFPFLVLSGVRFRVFGVGVTAMAMSVAAIWLAIQDASENGGMAGAILEVQVFLGVSVAAALALAVVLHENREALRKLAASEARFRELVERATDSIFVHDIEGQLLDVNEQACRSLGYQRDELLKLWVRDIEVGGDRDGTGPIWPRMKEGEVVTVDGVQRRKNGTIFPVELRLGLMNHEGRCAVMAVARDVTTRKRAEEQMLRARDAAEEASQAKSAFLANTSHELRTPLNAIIGYSELLEEEARENGHEIYVADLARIREAGQHLLDIITGILDLSKIESGKMDVDILPVELKLILEQSIASVEPLARQNGNSVRLDIDDAAGSIETDPVKLRQILLNLLSNAAKFTLKGEIVLRTRIERRRGVDWLMLEVSDTGIGIPTEKFDTLFDAFTQADSSTTRSFGGTGLGLAISRRYCELMGGQITVSSQPGKGATFTVWLPISRLRQSGRSAKRLKGDDRKSILHAR